MIETQKHHDFEKKINPIPNQTFLKIKNGLKNQHKNLNNSVSCIKGLYAIVKLPGKFLTFLNVRFKILKLLISVNTYFKYLYCYRNIYIWELELKNEKLEREEKYNYQRLD